ncbi:MAG: sugar transferase [Acidobacteria bacterium]|nr:sugar transferase [Acidobacteriota bacterium]
MIDAGEYKKLRIGVTLLGDLAAVALAYVSAFYLRATVPLPLVQDYMPFERFYQVHHYWTVLFGSQAAVLYFFSLYDPAYLVQRRQALLQIPIAMLLQFLSVVTFYFFRGEFLFPRSIFVSFYFLNSLLIIAWRGLLIRLTSRPQQKRVVLFGLGKTAREFIRNVEENPYFGLKIVGVVAVSDSQDGNGPIPAAREFEGYPILGGRDDLVNVIERHQVDTIVVTPESSWQDQLIDAIGRSEQTRANVLVVPSIFEMLISKMQHLKIQDIPLVEVVRNPTAGPRSYTKRILDIFFSLLLLALLFPAFLLVALLIKLSSPGPAIYRQKRVGYGRELFVVYKLRTMVEDAEAKTGAVLAAEYDKRITRLGRWLRQFRLDELPQLINILGGSMSFVGPRPERPEFVQEFARTIPGYQGRFKMKPGITGLAQVHVDYHTSAEMKLRYDLAYIYNHNLFMDLMIVLETIKIMLTRKGI